MVGSSSEQLGILGAPKKAVPHAGSRFATHGFKPEAGSAWQTGSLSSLPGVTHNEVFLGNLPWSLSHNNSKCGVSLSVDGSHF